MNETEGVVEVTSRPRKVVIILLVLWLATFAALIGVAWNAYLGEKGKNLTLAQQIDAACQQGDLGPGLTPDDDKAGLSPELEKRLCENAQAVIEQNDPELQDNEIQEEEIQQDEVQEREIQEREIQERENQNPENQNLESQEPEEQNSEDQEAEIQEPEEQESENQDPEIDDPDPASPYQFVFTFTIPSNGAGQPDRTYTVTCNSGTGNCTVQES